MAERKGLEWASDPAGLAECGFWLATASEASGPEDPESRKFTHSTGDAPREHPRVQGSDSGVPRVSDRALPALSIPNKSMRRLRTSIGLGLGRPGLLPWLERAHRLWPG